MSAEQNKATVRQMISLMNREDWEQAFRAEWKAGHTEEFINMHRPFRAAFPDFHWTLEDIVAEGETVVIHGKGRGTHMAEFPFEELKGVPGSGKQLEWDEVQFFRFENGQVADGWILPDGVSRLRQLGVLPEREHQPGAITT